MTPLSQRPPSTEQRVIPSGVLAKALLAIRRGPPLKIVNRLLIGVELAKAVAVMNLLGCCRRGTPYAQWRYPPDRFRLPQFKLGAFAPSEGPHLPLGDSKGANLDTMVYEF